MIASPPVFKILVCKRIGVTIWPFQVTLRSSVSHMTVWFPMGHFPFDSPDSFSVRRHVTLKGPGHDCNTLTVQYLENSWRVYMQHLTTIANYYTNNILPSTMVHVCTISFIFHWNWKMKSEKLPSISRFSFPYGNGKWKIDIHEMGNGHPFSIHAQKSEYKMNWKWNRLFKWKMKNKTVVLTIFHYHYTYRSRVLF